MSTSDEPAAAGPGGGGRVGPAATPATPRGRRATVLIAVAVVLVAATLAGLAALRSGRPGTDGPEAGFARDMSAHHAQAVRMSFIVRDRADDAATRLLAYDIINTQSAQIGMMTAWLDEWELPKSDPAGPMRWMSGSAGHGGHGGSASPVRSPASAPSPAAGDGAARMPGMATREQLSELEHASDRAAEVLFLRLMVVHHRAGVEMAEAVLARTGHARVRRLARTMVGGQQAEIDLMNRMLGERGSTAA